MVGAKFCVQNNVAPPDLVLDSSTIAVVSHSSFPLKACLVVSMKLDDYG